MIERLCRDQGWTPKDLEELYVSAGPGSFTGLRIGITLAKTLAFADVSPGHVQKHREPFLAHDERGARGHASLRRIFRSESKGTATRRVRAHFWLLSRV